MTSELSPAERKSLQARYVSMRAKYAMTVPEFETLHGLQKWSLYPSAERRHPMMYGPIRKEKGGSRGWTETTLVKACSARRKAESERKKAIRAAAKGVGKFRYNGKGKRS